MSIIKPSEYAARYLPVMVPGDMEAYPVQVDRYRIGNPKPAKDTLWGALGDHLARRQKADRGYQLRIVVNRMPLMVATKQQLLWQVVNPFSGKGSPEDCQVALQLAVKLGVAPATRLQAWANENIGLDCNGFAGNYLYRVVMGKDWRAVPNPKADPAPNADIATIFNWVLANGQKKPVQEISEIDPQKSYVVVRVDAKGDVMPGGPASLKLGLVGHIALTEPGLSMKQSFVTDSMGGLDLTMAQQGMYGKFALRTVESAGENADGISRGVHQNWMVFLGKVKGQPGVFEVRRDNIRKLDRVQLAVVPTVVP